VKRILLFAVAVATLTGAVGFRTPGSQQSNVEAVPIYGIKIPPEYRDWPLISVARVGGPVNDIRAKLGNDVAIRAFRAGTNPFPDGTIIARLAWKQVTSNENNAVFRTAMLAQGLSPDVIQKVLSESSVAGSPTNVQFMIKDSKKFASTGGWGFAQFTDGKPDGEAVHKTCFPCHAPAKDRDFVFTRYSH
jgi:hypothetical protein